MDEAIPVWGRTENGPAENWPGGVDGTPEQAVFLTHTSESGGEAEVLVSLLRSCGIPVLRRYEMDGGLGKIVLGFSGYGVSLYVPASMLEAARGIVEPEDGAYP